MLLIDRTFELLDDKKWHNIEEITEKFRLHHLKTIALIIFLEKYEFIKTNVTHQKMKIASTTYNFIKEIRAVEEKTGLSGNEVSKIAIGLNKC